MSSSTAKVSIFNKIRSAAAMHALPSSSTSPATNSYISLLWIRGANYFFSSSSSSCSKNKDPNLIDDIKQGEGVFRFDPSDGEPEMTPDHTKIHHNTTTTTAAGGGGGGVNYKSDDSSRTRTEYESNKDMSSNTMADLAKAGTVKAVETGINMGEMAKQTMDNVWETVKQTGHGIKEAVAGDEQQEKKGYDIPPTDSRVDDLRKKAGGYDLRNHH